MPPPSDPLPTVRAHVTAWLALQRGQVQPSTLESYRYQLTQYVLPHLGELTLDVLTPRLLTATWAALLAGGGRHGQPLGLRTVKYSHDVLRQALQAAVDDGLLAVNPGDGARPPRVAPDAAVDEPFRVWTAAQAARFLDRTRGHPFHLVWVLALATGMRRGEILGLRWDDVDEDAQTLHVRRALSIARDTIRLKTPKTGRTRRITIDQTVLDALRTRRRDQQRHRRAAGDAWRDAWGLVLTTEEGGPIYPSRISSGFARLVRRVDVPPIRFHDCRHSHATLLLLAGVPVHVVAARLGHAKPSMTLNVYAHVLPAADRDAADCIAALLHPTADEPDPTGGA